MLHSLVSGSTLFTRRSRTLLWESWHERVNRNKPELTHICLVYFSILTDLTSLFPVLRLSGVLFHFNLFCMEIPDQMPHSDLGLHCLPRSLKRDARVIWVNATVRQLYHGNVDFFCFINIYWQLWSVGCLLNILPYGEYRNFSVKHETSLLHNV